MAKNQYYSSIEERRSQMKEAQKLRDNGTYQEIKSMTRLEFRNCVLDAVKCIETSDLPINDTSNLELARIIREICKGDPYKFLILLNSDPQCVANLGTYTNRLLLRQTAEDIKARVGNIKFPDWSLLQSANKLNTEICNRGFNLSAVLESYGLVQPDSDKSKSETNIFGSIVSGVNSESMLCTLSCNSAMIAIKTAISHGESIGFFVNSDDADGEHIARSLITDNSAVTFQSYNHIGVQNSLAACTVVTDCKLENLDEISELWDKSITFLCAFPDVSLDEFIYSSQRILESFGIVIFADRQEDWNSYLMYLLK